jgi:hypothetical protein
VTGSPFRLGERLRKPWTLSVAVALLACAIMGVGWGFALWSSEAVVGDGAVSINHGALDASGPARSWELRNANGAVLAASEHANPDLAVGDLSNLTTPCGAGLKLVVDDSYTLTQRGDHLVAGVEVTWVGTTWPQGAYQLKGDDSAALTSPVSVGAPASAEFAPDQTGFHVVATYNLPTCDFFNSSAREYPAYSVEVKQL